MSNQKQEVIGDRTAVRYAVISDGYSAAMIVTGAFLAERAEAVNHRLNTVGAIWDHITVTALPVVEPPQISLVVLVRAASERRDHEHLTARLLDPDGDEVAQIRLDVTLPKGIEIGFALASLGGVAFEKTGRYLFVIDAPSGHGTTLPLDVRLAA